MERLEGTMTSSLSREVIREDLAGGVTRKLAASSELLITKLHNVVENQRSSHSIVKDAKFPTSG